MSSNFSTFICDVSHRGRICLMGEDRVRFLNGQVTNDVKLLSVGKGCYAAFCNAKGKMRADAVILNTGDSLLLDLEPGYDSKIAVELEKYLIADDVQIEQLTHSWKSYAVVGSLAVDLIREMECKTIPKCLFESISLFTEDFKAGLVYRSRRSRTDSFDFWIENSYHEKFQERLNLVLKKMGIAMVETSELEIARVEAGIPRFGSEIDENTIPQEANIESVAISYTKGCYLGQEVIARIKSIGHVNRTLVRLILPLAAQSGDSLFFEEKEIGKIGSAITSPLFGRIGLAIIKRQAANPNVNLTTIHGVATVVEDFC